MKLKFQFKKITDSEHKKGQGHRYKRNTKTKLNVIWNLIKSHVRVQKSCSSKKETIQRAQSW